MMVAVDLKSTASAAILGGLAAEGRHVVARWRAVLLLRRATFATPAGQRRWTRLPHDVSDIASLLNSMIRRTELATISGLREVLEVTVPYARSGHLDEREILLEVHPYACLSHLSALVFHGLTEVQPKRLIATTAKIDTGELLPIGTTTQDWDGIARPVGRRPASILGTAVDWQQVMPERFFGMTEYQSFGAPLRVSTVERTLIDGLMAPELSGGIGNVLNAWRLAEDTINLDAIVSLTERLGVQVLRQRVGYTAEQMGRTHPHFDAWQTSAKRGGSSRLVGAEPFSPRFDERWSLSLNAPTDILSGFDR